MSDLVKAFFQMTLTVAGVAAAVSVMAHVLAIPVFLRLRGRNRNLYTSLLLDPFRDAQWTVDLHEFCSTGDMVLVKRIRRWRNARQYSLLIAIGFFLVAVAIEIVFG
jgi:ABC-type spermidine/putrescine transport system permease subunit II